MDFLGKKHLLGYTRRACDEYNMIEAGDIIAVGVSGGKDSLSLLCALYELKKFYPAPFELRAVSVDMNFGELGRESADYSGVAALCDTLEVPFTEVDTHLARVIFETRRENNPCSLCAKMRRGILNKTAKELSCNKVALGHHYDDLLETFMLNLIHEGRIGTFLPVTYLSRVELTVIRPLILTPENELRSFAQLNSLPVVENPCPADGNTERESSKKLIAGLNRDYIGFKNRMFGAIKKAGLLERGEE